MADVQEQEAGQNIPVLAVDPEPSEDELVPGVPESVASQDEQDRSEANLGYATCQQYYDGSQYDEENDAFAERAGYTARGLRVPEHLRKHAYSSHIQEAIDVISDMFAEGITFDGAYADQLNLWWEQSGMDSRVDDWFREGLVKGDVYAIPDYDPVTDRMAIDVWEADSTWPVYDRSDWRNLVRYYQYEQTVDSDGVEHDVKHVYVLLDTFLPMPGVSDTDLGDIDTEFPPVQIVKQLVEYVFVDDELKDVRPHNRGFFSLVHGRGDTRHRLRSMFGDSMVTRKVRGTADRFNALGQLGFRVARQNSFSTIAVVGDSAALGAGARDETIAKDIADVLRFPGGTNVSTITLPTDPRMIEYQQRLLEKNMYREFGLTKIDLEDFGGLGTVSGYALEVLNRKERATYQRVRKNALTGLMDLANRQLDIHAIAKGTFNGQNWWEIDPQEVYPNREDIQIVLGTGDIVDAVSDRDDFAAGIVSREYVLRRKGLSKEDITQVVDEIAAQKERDQQVITQAQLAINDQQNTAALDLAQQNAENATKQAVAVAAATPTTSSSGSSSSATQASRQTGTTQK